VLLVPGFAALAPAQATALGRPQTAAPPPSEVIAAPTPIPMPRIPTMQAPSPPVLQARFLQPAGRARPGSATGDDEGQLDYQIQLEPPGIERLLLSLTSDADLQERIRQETLKRSRERERVTFPEEPILSRDRYYGRGAIWPQRGLIAEPNYVCYDKLLFEDKNAERYGWEIGMLQPFISAGLFFADFAVLPCRCFKDPCSHSECSAGQCLPGDPVPFRLYPPEITASGTLAEAVTILALIVIFP
jgi:hypothetical protein